MCADGETLLTKDIDLYIKELAEEGHYIEIVTNMTVTPVIDKILSFEKKLLEHIEFKCSFHYLQLKEKGWLEKFAENVKNVWKAGASANIELVPNDELIPYIEEVKEFSMAHFGALPHLTIARDETVPTIEYLTKLPLKLYDNIWSQFHSDFWAFKKTVFGVKQTNKCYAGQWSAYINLATGTASACYGQGWLGDVFAHPETPFPERCVGQCKLPHCYNAHALLTMGLIPGTNFTHYGDIRDKVKEDGEHWLNPKLKDFFNNKLEETHKQ